MEKAEVWIEKKQIQNPKLEAQIKNRLEKRREVLQMQKKRIDMREAIIKDQSKISTSTIRKVPLPKILKSRIINLPPAKAEVIKKRQEIIQRVKKKVFEDRKLVTSSPKYPIIDEQASSDHNSLSKPRIEPLPTTQGPSSEVKLAPKALKNNGTVFMRR